MASIHLGQNADCYDNTHIPTDSDDFGEAEVSPRIPSDSHDAVDKFGEPEILPRIGNEYQVELPELTGESNSISHSTKCTDSETRADAHQNFLVGLPIMLTWIGNEEQDMIGSRRSTITSSDFTHSDSKNITKAETSFGEVGPSHDSRKLMEELQNSPIAEKICKCSGPGDLLVPGLFDEYWSAAEKHCFLLGLYIFEKNFVEVRRFVGTKQMGAVLSYYYGKFYCSPEYRRWSECRKMKSKKGIFGQRIFSGLRQQELLSRILSRVSDECQKKLSEATKTFGDEKMSLGDYVFSLKAVVGTKILVEAVGIGTGKQDLTGLAFEPSRANQTNPVRPEIPTGKACSSLTTAEIIMFLSGDYRLSKARSNDLFWEAVWPRLLARGWHSEQPKNQGYVAGSKHCLVFLMPGVKKFSRRKLVKGDHYFDSVTDVLSKVAQEPGLIELDTEEVDGGKRKEEDESASERMSKQNDNDLPTSPRHCYLQPRTPNRSTVVMKFTVVDTCVSDGNVRELRTLPSEISNAFIAPDHAEDSDEDTPEDNTVILDESTTDVSPETTESDEKILPGKKDSNVTAMDEDAPTVCPDINDVLIPEKSTKDLQGNARSRTVSEPVLSREFEQQNEDYMAPITKRPRILTACSQEETRAGSLSFSIPPRLENELSNCCSDTHEVTEDLFSQVGMCQNKLSSTSSSRSSPRESTENPRTQLLIDLNLPQVPLDSEDGFCATDLMSNEQDIVSNKLDEQGIPKPDIQTRSEDQSNLNPRRHSTRNRPPTTRALEAVADGYLTVNRRRKRKDTSSLHEDQALRPSQRACGVVGRNESTSSSVASQMTGGDNDVSNSGNCNMFLRPQVPPQANEESVSGQ